MLNRILGTLVICCCFFSINGSAQQTQGALTNERIGGMVLAGVSQGEIVRIIAAAETVNFDLRPNSTDALLKVGVSDDIIKAMAARESGTAPAVSAPVRSARAASAPAPSGTRHAPDGRPRIFVGETSEWQASSFNVAHYGASYTGFSGSAAAGSFGMAHAGLMKLTVSVMNQINLHCTNVVIVDRPELADLFIRLDQSTSMWARHDDMAVFNLGGEMMFVASTHSMSKDVKRFCKSLSPRKP
jgi:hypothetical protein